MKSLNIDSAIRLLLIFALSIFVACEKDEPINPELFKEPSTQLNVSYGKSEAQKMDVYLPANRSNRNTKVLLLLHGGAWATGSKEDLNEFIPKLQQTFGSDFAIINMNYRLVNIFGTFMLPTQIDDIESALSFIEKNAENWGIKPSFVTFGESAGAHLAMLHAYHFDSKKRIKAVVNVVGPTDLTDPFYSTDPLYSIGLNYIIRSKDIPDGITATQYASPLQWVNNQSPATISFYGKRDHLIPFSQTEKFENKIKQQNMTYEMHIYDGGHDILRKMTDDIVSKTKQFLGQIK